MRKPKNQCPFFRSGGVDGQGFCDHKRIDSYYTPKCYCSYKDLQKCPHLEDTSSQMVITLLKKQNVTEWLETHKNDIVARGTDG